MRTSFGAACAAWLGLALPGGPVRAAGPAGDPRQTTVVWVSIDGFRHDYRERLKPPTLTKLAAEGAFTDREQPIFPSLTFPNHVAQVTGTGVDGSGIPMNNFYDEAAGKSYSFPDQSSLLRDEPIWITATRQGIRVCCVDWPMSHAQAGPVKAAYFDQAFDTREGDRHRLDRILTLLNNDHDAQPYRLIMGYMSGVDHAGHAGGPDSDAVADAVATADDDVAYFVAGVRKWFEAVHAPTDDLIFIFSTDHGMANIKEQVSLDRLIGADLVKGVEIVPSGPMATIHTLKTPPDRADLIIAKLKPYDFLTVWKAADMPPQDHYSDPTRIGQVVVMLKPGYGWSRSRLATTLPVPRNGGGNHGYDPASCPDMQGSAVIWRLRTPIGGKSLGPIENTQWDATVCKLLGIQPPAGADLRAVEMPH